MINFFKTTGRGRFLLTLLSPIGLIALFFFVLSPEAVSHPIHAIKIENRHLHGWNLSCEKLANSPSYRCETELQGKLLEIKTIPHHVGLASGPVDCDAWFDSQEITCHNAYITSSYWSRGIEIPNSPELTEAFMQEPSWRNWQSIFYGWYEFEYIQFGAILTILYALFAFTLSFKRFSAQPTLPIWLQIAIIGTGSSVFVFFIMPRIAPNLIADFSMGSIHRGEKSGRFDWFIWGLPLLTLGTIAAASWNFGWKMNKSKLLSAIANSLSLSFILFFLTYAVVFLQLILLDYID